MGGAGSGPQKGGGSDKKQTSFQKRHSANVSQASSAQAAINKALGVTPEAVSREQAARQSFRKLSSSPKKSSESKPSVSRKDVGSKHDIGKAKFIEKKDGLATFRGDFGIK